MLLQNPCTWRSWFRGSTRSGTLSLQGSANNTKATSTKCSHLFLFKDRLSKFLLHVTWVNFFKNLFRHVSASNLIEKNDISGFIWHKSFIKTVEYSFFNQSFVNQHFCGARHSRCNIFFFKLICVSAHVGRSFVKYTLSSYEWSGLWFGTWRLIDLISFYAIVDKNDIS